MKNIKNVAKIVSVVVLLFSFVLTITGCSVSEISSPTPKPTHTNNNPTITPQPTQPTTEYPNEPPNSVTWISPGKVEVGNFYPGATADWTIRVHNGNGVSTDFLVKYRYPDHVGDGYSFPTDSTKDWITISTGSITFGPYETRDIPISLHMPDGAVSPGNKWEFWISVIDNSQEGFVRTELCVRWLISMQ